MNETLYDLEQKRNAVELDIQALYETLQQEINENKKDVREWTLTSFVLFDILEFVNTYYHKDIYLKFSFVFPNIL